MTAVDQIEQHLGEGALLIENPIHNLSPIMWQSTVLRESNAIESEKYLLSDFATDRVPYAIFLGVISKKVVRIKINR